MMLQDPTNIFAWALRIIFPIISLLNFIEYSSLIVAISFLGTFIVWFLSFIYWDFDGKFSDLRRKNE